MSRTNLNSNQEKRVFKKQQRSNFHYDFSDEYECFKKKKKNYRCIEYIHIYIQKKDLKACHQHIDKMQTVINILLENNKNNKPPGAVADI